MLEKLAARSINDEELLKCIFCLKLDVLQQDIQTHYYQLIWEMCMSVFILSPILSTINTVLLIEVVDRQYEIFGLAKGRVA